MTVDSKKAWRRTPQKTPWPIEVHTEAAGLTGWLLARNPSLMKSSSQHGEARFLAGIARPDGYLAPTGPEVVFAGRSNVGKSSLLNALLRRRGLARVSKTPGRTQQVNFFQTGDLGVFVDLPGYGFARAPERVRHQWKALVNAYLEGDRPVVICLLLADARHDPTPQDLQLCNWLRHAGLPYRIILTKADAVGKSRIGQVVRRAGEILELTAGEEKPLPVSVRTGNGIDRVRALIHHAVNL